MTDDLEQHIADRERRSPGFAARVGEARRRRAVARKAAATRRAESDVIVLVAIVLALLLTACGGPPTVTIHNPTGHDVDVPSIHWAIDKIWRYGLDTDVEIWFAASRWEQPCPDGQVPDWAGGRWWCATEDAIARLPGCEVVVRLREETSEPSCLAHTGLVHELIHCETGIKSGDYHSGGEWVRQRGLEEALREEDPNCS